MSLELSRGRDVILYTSRGVPLQADGAGGLVFGERVGSALVACVAGLKERPAFLLSKGGITSSDVATQALGMKRGQVSRSGRRVRLHGRPGSDHPIDRSGLPPALPADWLADR